MKIQLITNRIRTTNKTSNNLTISRLATPKSLDEFDVNVIDLSEPDLWVNDGPADNAINALKDLDSISKMVQRKNKSAIIYAYPQNISFRYYGRHGLYQYSKQLKDCIELIIKICATAFPDYGGSFIPIVYENTITKIGELEYKASFFFDGIGTPYTKSQGGGKYTTISFGDGIYLTTLAIVDTDEALLNYLYYLFDAKSYEETPDWAKDVLILNDRELLFQIEECQKTIRQAESTIQEANKELQANNQIKSILYSNGDKLVEGVFHILEKILSCDLSEFVDKKKEDFLIKKEEYTLIGEIKGVTSNVKNEHISQVDVHYQGYQDKLLEENLNENVHQILVINTFRNKPLSEREPVNDGQIWLAERNKCLIVETATLLKLYEKFVSGEIDVLFCERIFTEKTGLLRDEDF